MAGSNRPAPDDLDAGEAAAAAIIAAALGEITPDDAAVSAGLLIGDATMVANAVPLDAIALRVNTDLLPVLVNEYRTVVLDEITRHPVASFDPTIAAREWAEVHAGKLIVDVSASTRAGVADLVRDGLGRGASIDAIAAGIRRTVGLHSAYALAVDRRHRQLLRDGVLPARARILSDRYAGKLRTTRSKTIARWEVQSGRNTARFNTWQASYEAGGIAPGMRKRWVVARPCDVCAALAAEEPVPWNQPFSNGLQMPPEHPRCKCTASLVPLA